jgi:hypothetical protein
MSKWYFIFEQIEFFLFYLFSNKLIISGTGLPFECERRLTHIIELYSIVFFCINIVLVTIYE